MWIIIDVGGQTNYEFEENSGPVNLSSQRQSEAREKRCRGREFEEQKIYPYWDDNEYVIMSLWRRQSLTEDRVNVTRKRQAQEDDEAIGQTWRRLAKQLKMGERKISSREER